MRIVNFVITVTVLVAPGFGEPQKSKSGAGQATFQEQCAGCHGPDGRAQTEMGRKVQAADLTADAVQQHSEAELSNSVKNGKDKMPPFADKLSDDEIRAVVAYVKQLGKKQ